MILALLLPACWRPEPYTPPPPPEDVEAPAGEAAEEGPDEAPEGEEGAADAEEAPGEPAEEGAAEEGAPPDEEDVPSQPDFKSYRAKTVSAPVTIVDDWGKPLAVLGVAAWELEVRGEEPIRTRVWCATCDPAVEGWLQPHLLARVE